MNVFSFGSFEFLKISPINTVVYLIPSFGYLLIGNPAGK